MHTIVSWNKHSWMEAFNSERWTLKRKGKGSQKKPDPPPLKHRPLGELQILQLGKERSTPEQGGKSRELGKTTHVNRREGRKLKASMLKLKAKR